MEEQTGDRSLTGAGSPGAQKAGNQRCLVKGLAKGTQSLVGHGIRRLRTRLYQFYKGGAMWRDRLIGSRAGD